MHLRNDQVELITDEMMLAFDLDNNKTEKYTILCVEFYILLHKFILEIKLFNFLFIFFLL